MWYQAKLRGKFDALSPALNKFNWLLKDTVRTLDDSAGQGMRFLNNLLYVQIGYELDEHFQVSLGYVHESHKSLNSPLYYTNRAYEQLEWKSDFYDGKFLLRSRVEQRVNQSTGDLAIRLREKVQVTYPLAFINKHWGVYVGDELFGYLNKNSFGRQWLSNNRVSAGLSYRLNPQARIDLGYLGRYMWPISGDNYVFTHNLELKINYDF